MLPSGKTTGHIKSGVSKRTLLTPRRLAAGLFIVVLAVALTNEFFLFITAAIVLGLILVPIAPALAILFYAAVLALSVPINDVPITVADFRFYGADFAFYFVACIAAYAIFNAFSGKRQSLAEGSRLERWLVAIVVLNLIWGVVELANGIYIDNLEPRDAIGDFRRIYLYMLAVLIPIGLPIGISMLRKIPYALAIGGVGAVLFGLQRMASGVLYHSYTSHVESPRILGDNELVALSFLLAYALALMGSKEKRFGKMFLLPLGALALAFMLISGWRYGILLAIAVPIVVLLTVAFVKGARFGRLAWSLVAVSIVALLGAVVVFGVFEETTNYIWQARRARQQDLQGDIRVVAYATALNEFAQKPLLGTGLGHQLSYFAVATDGSLLNRQTTTHNIFIDVLYQTGVPGCVLFLALHALFFRLFLRNVRHIFSDLHALAVALFVGYVFIMGLFCMQPSHVSAVMTMYLTIGFVLRILRYRVPEESSLQPVA